MFNEDNANYWRDQSDPFGVEYYLVPPEEEMQARAEYVRQENENSLRHRVEWAIWEALDNPDLLKVLVSLLWQWEAIDPKWMAEASFKSVSDVRDISESQARLVFPCLVCGAEIASKNRQHVIRMQSSVQDYCTDQGEHSVPTNLLCGTCQEQMHNQAEQQRSLDEMRYQALLAEYRRRPYPERRTTREWAVLKRQIHKRDGYRCRLCARDDVQLHVHHRTYANYAEEQLEDLITLCRDCHGNYHFRSEAS